MAHLRAILWRINSGEVTDWGITELTEPYNETASITLYYPTGL
jgi:hypothetical protein